jgi:hypothetical protein
MTQLRQYFYNKFKIDFESLSLTKQYTLRAFKSFTNIAEPEIQSSIMKTAYDFVTQWVGSKIIKKPDSELKPMIYDVLKELGPLIKDVELAAEIKAMEVLGAVPVPRVGQIVKKLELVDVNNEAKAIEILKSLMR